MGQPAFGEDTQPLGQPDPAVGGNGASGVFSAWIPYLVAGAMGRTDVCLPWLPGMRFQRKDAGGPAVGKMRGQEPGALPVRKAGGTAVVLPFFGLSSFEGRKGGRRLFVFQV